ncbi:hypothetical protein PHYPSEUDO_001736 [Phytophthora pseudosyringae]|uniref:Tyrosine specific protein phosphatases domain-containing protein n=1 Tax=Phytophthora pseudosyringae TaxID=221518 RepID=A0A8T1VZX2_9STRA|nr:hypothetical protein PHYPSEUDO_001736 [Phytophthora pseudosyringae]
MPRGRSRSISPPRHHHRRRRSRSPRRPRSPRRSEPRNSRRNRSKRREMAKKNRIPDNWDDVAKMGAIVGTSRFVPLRVPLDDKYLPQFQSKSEEIWTPKDFLEAQEEQQLNVKMLVDLTNTFKYYNGEGEFKDSGVHYVKHKIEGFNGPPDGRDVATFMHIVDDFVAKEPEGTIAVHCTHGLNRTGYLIVTYMVKRLDYSVAGALEAFAVARPPGLIKHMYVEDLYTRLGNGEEVQLPELPEWASAKYSKRATEGRKGGYRGKRSNDSKYSKSSHDSRDKYSNRGKHSSHGDQSSHDDDAKHKRFED